MLSSRQRMLAFCRRNTITKAATAFVLVGIAFVLTLLMPIRDPAFYSFFLAVIAATGILVGWKSAIFSTFLSALISSYFFVKPAYAFSFSDKDELYRFLGFCGAAVIICVMSALLETSTYELSVVNRKVQQAEDALVRHSNERELLEQSAKFWMFEIDLERDTVQWTDVYKGIRVARSHPFQSWLDQVHPDDRERVRMTVHEALISGEFESKFRFFVRMGEDKPHSVLGRARVVVRDGKSIILRGINVDLSTAEDSNLEVASSKSASILN